MFLRLSGFQKLLGVFFWGTLFGPYDVHDRPTRKAPPNSREPALRSAHRVLMPASPPARPAAAAVCAAWCPAWRLLEYLDSCKAVARGRGARARGHRGPCPWSALTPTPPPSSPPPPHPSSQSPAASKHACAVLEWLRWRTAVKKSTQHTCVLFLRLNYDCFSRCVETFFKEEYNDFLPWGLHFHRHTARLLWTRRLTSFQSGCPGHFS